MVRPKKDPRQQDIFKAFHKSQARRGARSTTSSDVDIEASNDALDLNAEPDIDEEDDMSDEEFDEFEECDGTTVKKQFKRVWKPSWLIPYPWNYCVGIPPNQRIKCKWCVEFKMDTPFAKRGSSSIQRGALATHDKSEVHKLATLRMEAKKKPPTSTIPKAVVLMCEQEKARIISVMKCAYKVASQMQSLKEYERLCEFQRLIGTPNMPINDEYSSYTNLMAGKDFMAAAHRAYLEVLLKEVVESPFYSIMVDESTDRSLEQHLIVYVCYLTEKGKGIPCTRFLKLLGIKDGTSNTLYQSLVSCLNELGLPMSRLVGIATDGCSAMVGSQNGLVTQLRRDVPHLVGVHCIAHREALAASDAFNYFPVFKDLEKLARKVSSWVGRSSRRHASLRSLEEVFELPKINLQQIHDVRWLSRGNVISRIVKLMPALMRLWVTNEEHELLSSFKKASVQFYFHFLADVLLELNVLNKLFQEGMVEISSISSTVSSTIAILDSRYLGTSFGRRAKYTTEFLAMVQEHEGHLLYKDDGGFRHRYMLSFDTPSFGDMTIASCVKVGQEFVRKVISCLKQRFNDRGEDLLASTKLFSTNEYPMDSKEMEDQTYKWTSTLCNNFGEGKYAFLDIEKCKGQAYSFVVRLQVQQSRKNMKTLWDACRVCDFYFDAYDDVMKLWQAVLVLPASSVECERGFRRQNLIKDDDRESLNLKTLEMLMFLSLSSPDVADADYEMIYANWMDHKQRRMVQL